MKTALKFIFAALVCFIALVFLVAYGYQIIPFESIWAEITLGCTLISMGSLCLGQGIWLLFQRELK